VYTAFQ
jgi:hypothetical protein